MPSLALACRLSAATVPRPLPRRVRNILSKYDATLLMPGASGVAVQTFSPGNYVESAGQNLTPVDGAVGLVTDAAGSVGANLIRPAIWWSKQSGVTVAADGTITCVGVTATLAASQGIIQANKTYAVEADVTGLTSGSVSLTLEGGAATTPTLATNGKLYGILKATATGNIFVYARSSPLTCVISNIYIRELPGIHATQPTTQNKPVLRNTDGIQYWQFDGVDDRLTLSAVPFQMADDHWVVGGAEISGSGTRILFSIRNTSNTFPIVAQVFVGSNGVLSAFWRNAENTGGATPELRAPSGAFTFSAKKAGASCSLRANGGAWVTVSAPGGSFPVNNAVLGASGENSTMPFSGNCPGVIFGKGAISDSELLTLERFLATLQGRRI